MKFFFILLTLFIFLNQAFGVSAFPGLKTFKQNNESQFKGSLKGDEWLNYVSLPNDYVAVYNNETKNYEYALIEVKDGKSKLVSSGQAVNEGLHLDNPEELAKSIPPLDIDALSKLDPTSGRDLFMRQVHDLNKSNYKNKVLKTKSTQWKEILKEKDLPE